MKRILATLAMMIGLLSVSSAANAQSIIRNPEDHSHIGIDVHGTFDYWWGYGFGGGARVEIPLVHSGFIHSINNSFGLSLGGDFMYRAGYYADYGFFAIAAHADVQWNFYLTPKWSVFAEAGWGPEFWIGGCPPGANCQAFWPFFFDAGVGGRYHFGNGNNGNPALILRVTYSYVNFGVEF